MPSSSPDELVTTAIDGMDHVDAKMAAMRAHATQITVDGPFFALSNNLGNEVWGIEYYRAGPRRAAARSATPTAARPTCSPASTEARAAAYAVRVNGRGSNG